MVILAPTGSTPFPSVENQWQYVVNQVNAELGALSASLSGKASNTVTVAAGTGLKGGGDLTTGRTLSVDFAATTDTTSTTKAETPAGAQAKAAAAAFAKGNPSPINADTYRTPGTLHIGGPNATNSTGLPRAEPCDLTVYSDPGNTAWASQTVTYYGTNPEFYWRTSRNTTGAWNAWVKVGQAAPTTITVDYGLAHTALRDEWMGRVGGPVPTGGKAAVALRFDHGLTTMKSSIVPLLTARNLKWGMAMNSRNWTLAQNSGATKANVIAWCSQGGEVWNHGATHNDRTDQAGIYDEIVKGLSELRADLPGVPIDGYIPAGVGGTGLNGFNGGTTPQEYSGTYAGQLILSNHAVGLGNFPGTSTRRTLDGTPKIGQGHTTMDTLTLTAIKSRINDAVAAKSGLLLMVHPDNVGQPGYISLADLTAVFDYIVSLRTAGTLVTLSPYELARADSRF